MRTRSAGEQKSACVVYVSLGVLRAPQLQGMSLMFGARPAECNQKETAAVPRPRTDFQVLHVLVAVQTPPSPVRSLRDAEKHGSCTAFPNDPHRHCSGVSLLGCAHCACNFRATGLSFGSNHFAFGPSSCSAVER